MWLSWECVWLSWEWIWLAWELDRAVLGVDLAVVAMDLALLGVDVPLLGVWCGCPGSRRGSLDCGSGCLGMGLALLDGLAVVPWSTRQRSLLARIAGIRKGY